MSLDLFVLAPEDAPTFEHAMNVVMGAEPGVADSTDKLKSYAREVYDPYSDDDWPFAGDPIVEESIGAGPVRHVPERRNPNAVALARVLRGGIAGADDGAWYPTRGRLSAGAASRVGAVGAPHGERDDQCADRGEDSDHHPVFSDLVTS